MVLVVVAVDHPARTTYALQEPFKSNHVYNSLGLAHSRTQIPSNSCTRHHAQHVFTHLGLHFLQVFEAEYSTVLLTAAHPNLIACCQGFWMGLGFGIAGYAPVRIVSDGTVFAMPGV